MASGKQLEEWLDDLCVRFIINLPRADLSTVARICFQIEEAQWFYEDFIRARDPRLPSMSLRLFCLRIFQHCPLLAFFPKQNRTVAFEEFLHYKTRVPVRGAIMLNHITDSVVLVKGWKKGARWSFPRGKINKDELDLDCAIREVFEETGLDLRAAGLVPSEQNLQFIEMSLREQQFRLYIFRDIPMSTVFMPRTRKEISKVQWHKLSDLSALNNKRLIEHNHLSNKFYLVTPFLVPLRSWIRLQEKKEGQSVPNESTEELYPKNGKSGVGLHTDQWDDETENFSNNWPLRTEHEEEQIYRNSIENPECTSELQVLPLLQEDRGRSLLTVLQGREDWHGNAKILPKLPYVPIAQKSSALTLNKSLQPPTPSSSMSMYPQSADDTSVSLSKYIPQLVQKNSNSRERMDSKRWEELRHPPNEALALFEARTPCKRVGQDLKLYSAAYRFPSLKTITQKHNNRTPHVEPTTRSHVIKEQYGLPSCQLKHDDTQQGQHTIFHPPSDYHVMNDEIIKNIEHLKCPGGINAAKSSDHFCTGRMASRQGNCAMQAEEMRRDHSFSELTASSFQPALSVHPRENSFICLSRNSEVEHNVSNSTALSLSSMSQPFGRGEGPTHSDKLMDPSEIPQKLQLLSLFDVRKPKDKSAVREEITKDPRITSSISSEFRQYSISRPPLSANYTDFSISHAEQGKLLEILQDTLARAMQI